MTNRFDEDRPNTQVNTDILEREFNLDTTDERNDQLAELREMRMQLRRSVEDCDPDELLMDNVQRANELLDTAQQQILNGGQTNARLYEICAQLINAVTSAANSITSNAFGNQKHDYNMKVLELKEQELVVKSAMLAEKMGTNAGRQVTEDTNDGKVVVMDRNTLLEMIENEAKEVELNSGQSTDSIDIPSETQNEE